MRAFLGGLGTKWDRLSINPSLLWWNGELWNWWNEAGCAAMIWQRAFKVRGCFFLEGKLQAGRELGAGELGNTHNSGSVPVKFLGGARWRGGCRERSEDRGTALYLYLYQDRLCKRQ